MTKRKQPSTSIEAEAADCGKTRPMGSSSSEELVAVPVEGSSSGEGLPYAPEGWPNKGDVWKWKVRRRKTSTGYWRDRYLYPPSGFPKIPGGRTWFNSKLAVRDYLQKEFPCLDVDAFFASFIWRVPAGECAKNDKGLCQEENVASDERGAFEEDNRISDMNMSSKVSEVVNFGEQTVDKMISVAGGYCKAGNKKCPSKTKEQISLASMACDLCCRESNFCSDCCCILCSKTIDNNYSGYSFIRCKASTVAGFVCGHVAHLNCALRSYTAGTVGGAIKLDVEYYCRRCDNKTDLFCHVTKLLKTCKSIDVPEDAIKILSIGICILHKSEQIRAKNLQNHMELAISKLKCRVPLDEIWKGDEDITSVTSGGCASVNQNQDEVTMLGSRSTGHAVVYPKIFVHPSNLHVDSNNKITRSFDKSAGPIYIAADHRDASTKLDEDKNRALRELKESQESVYEAVQQQLSVQKELLISLYHNLDRERFQLVALPRNIDGRSRDGDLDAVLVEVLEIVDRIKAEEMKLRDMLNIVKKVQVTSTGLISKYFDKSY